MSDTPKMCATCKHWKREACISGAGIALEAPCGWADGKQVPSWVNITPARITHYSYGTRCPVWEPVMEEAR